MEVWTTIAAAIAPVALAGARELRQRFIHGSETRLFKVLTAIIRSPREDSVITVGSIGAPPAESDVAQRGVK